MELMLNECSLHGQFHDPNTFYGALENVMLMRSEALRYDRSLYCHRALLEARLGPNLVLRQAVQSMPRDRQRAFLLWATQHGPFWDDVRAHQRDDYLACGDQVVTDTGLGEAAYANLRGLTSSVVSFVPSDYGHDPIPVDWIRSSDSVQALVPNHWSANSLKRALEASQPPLASWHQLEAAARKRCEALSFSQDAFLPLDGHPFVHGAAARLLFLLTTLARLKECHDNTGKRTDEGHALYRDYFEGTSGGGGRGPAFSDSSESEKRNFVSKLTFRHPTSSDATLFCPWHGKVQTPQLRVHFSSPINASSPLYVVYIGPKLTKR